MQIGEQHKNNIIANRKINRDLFQNQNAAWKKRGARWEEVLTAGRREGAKTGNVILRHISNSVLW